MLPDRTVFIVFTFEHDVFYTYLISETDEKAAIKTKWHTQEPRAGTISQAATGQTSP